MAIRSFSSEYNFMLIFDNDKIYFKDLNQFEDKTYKVEADEAEQLQRMTNLSVADAAAILGKVEQIRVCSGTGKNRKPNKVDFVKLNQVLAIILVKEDWRELFCNLREAKFYQIVEMCESDHPVAYYENCM